ncbi:hypothetical protein OC834_000111 [Tilletia horrida]|uniref:Uncharacterized protein n=1 Tax=Tilletia horrida TaxID=155126 RepID=A0AAN6GHX2_9BASI|nr:hypothetical protein OC835_002409 [Tilletia horrida]KAK0539260.1 hypothetical protein OC834_000111 [Tilletia horrida]KAK0540188.1 hypothetical protein OC842_000580 [Tilletia horrida]KAK0563538.1 hypothetical protein OC844_002170 [Tilletia horrida]
MSAADNAFSEELSSPTSSPVLARSLRRKRSSANAALTTRPSHLNLRDTFHPSLDTLVLVHMSTAPGGTTTLVRALMEPNFLVDSQGRVTRLDRETWERVRDSVEALRIVGTSSNSNGNYSSSPPGLSTLPTPDQSPDLSLPLNPSHQASARAFNVCPPDTPLSSRATSTLLMQPKPRRSEADPPVSAASELLAFLVHGVSGDGPVDEGSWLMLPNQMRVLLMEAEHLARTYPTGTGPVQEGVCEAILNLVRS